jgi:hypothetical protein
MNDEEDEYNDGEDEEEGEEGDEEGEEGGSIFDSPPSDTHRDENGNIVDKDGNVLAWDDTKSWVSFSKSLFYFFIISLMIGVFGSGFCYLTSRGIIIDYILPTYRDFYNVKSYYVDKKGPYIDVNCVEVNTGNSQVIEENFPYNLIVKDENGREYSDAQCKFRQAKESKDPEFKKKYTLPITTHITDWVAQITRSVFMRHRDWLKSYLNVFDPDSPFGNHAFQICLAFPFTVSISIVSVITGIVYTFIAAFSTGHLKLPICGLIFAYLIFIAIGMGVIMYLRLLITICLLPLIQNWKEVANIMSCNVKIIAIIFGYFVCGAAYDNLDQTISGIMAIVYLILVVHTIYKYFKK